MSEIKQGYKQTKVGIIPEDWEVVYFDDIFIFSTGKNIKQNEASPDFEIPCVRYGELYHMYDEIITKVINKTNLDKSELLFSKGNEILLPSAGEDPLDIGSASALTLKNIAIGRTINVLRPSKKNIYSQEYIAYYINHQLKTKIASLAKGSSISNVYNSDLKKLKIPLPPLKEQEKIAEILTTWDEAITKQTELLEAKELQKKALMQKLLSGEVRFDGFNDEWEEVRLGDIGEFKTSSIDKIVNENEKLVNLINYMDVYRNKHIDQNFKCSETSLKEEQYEKVNLKKGDILFTPSSETPDDIGHSAVILEDLLNTIYSYHLVRFRPKKSIDLKFSGYVFNNVDILKEFAKRANGSTRFTLSIKDFNETKAKFPSLPEQQKIAEVLSLSDAEINLL
ncbi:MAG: type restriction enzyme subunit, partial [Campylobacterota bacterium]|nr:type restriction enzyme subunit [Campylobacterota bacterium]